jgi:alkylation response protein AidB-like acyl-CoA dehydrogenase
MHLLEGVRLSVLDSAWRLATDRPRADVAAALCWLLAEDVSRTVSGHCHQVFGALGFCTETGLIQLTEAAKWLRLSVGRTSAIDRVRSQRAVAGGDPPSLVLAGFSEVPPYEPITREA